MNCDLLSRTYRLLEHAAFGTKLEEQRCEFLHQARQATRALLLGEGDGRFLVELAKVNTHAEIDCMEASPRMIQVAERRLAATRIVNPGRIHFYQTDALLAGLPGSRYDLVVTHFFLDCFSAGEINQLIPDIRSVCVPGAKWLIAEFQEPKKGWRRWHAHCWLTAMYWFFRITTGLKTQRLPDYRAALLAAGFSPKSQQLRMAQLISSELWELETSGLRKAGPAQQERQPSVGAP